MKSKQRQIRNAEIRAGNGSTHDPRPRSDWKRHPAVLAGLLVLLVVAAYLPALRGGFIWDDDVYVTENPMLTSTNGLREIWFSAHAQSQYFPLVYTTFRCERMLWGLNPFGFHLVNVLLHGFNAVLVWIVLRRLRAPGAWLAAAIFALHPAQVETVAWVTELKNIESLLFYLLALLAWIKFVDAPGPPDWRYYGLALAAYLPALFAKTTACTLPAAMVLVLWLRGRPFSWPRAAQILPFLVVGLGMGLLTVWWEKHLGNYEGEAALSLGFLQRALIAGRALWFYAGKLAWPADLTFSYPHWDIRAAEPLQYLPLAACVGLAVAMWAWRKKIGRGTLAGMVFFVAALSPLLGFINEYTFLYTYVADHYQYSACIGLIAVFAAVFWRRIAKTAFMMPASGALLLALGCLTWQQCGAYRNSETIWRDTVAKNPGSWMARHNLGRELFKQGRLDSALVQFRAAAALYPQGDREQADLGTALLEKRLYPEAIQHLEAALAVNPNSAPIRNSLALAYAGNGDFNDAVAQFRKALELDPGTLGVYMNLGGLLQRQGRLDEAVEIYRDASKRFPAEVEPLRRLAGVFAEQEKFSLAAETCRQALQIAPNNADLLLDLGNIHLAETNYAAAEDCYRRALLVEPGSAGLHYNLGIVQGRQGRTEAERQELRESLRLKPDFTPARQELLLLDARRADSKKP